MDYYRERCFGVVLALPFLLCVLADGPAGAQSAKTRKPESVDINKYFASVSAQAEAMVGRKAPPIVASHWFNAPGVFRSYDPLGKVTILMISSPTCAPCEESYPVLEKLRTQYAPRGLRVIVAAGLEYSLFEGSTMTPAEEFAKLKKHFLMKDKLRVMVAIDTTTKSFDDDAARRGITPDPIARAYPGLGWPRFYWIDRDGIIRAWNFGGIGQGSDHARALALTKEVIDRPRTAQPKK